MNDMEYELLLYDLNIDQPKTQPAQDKLRQKIESAYLAGHAQGMKDKASIDDYRLIWANQ